MGTTYTETENGSPTLSKSGDGTLSGTTSGSKLTYGNRTATTSRSTTVTATYSEVSKSINITQSAGVKTNITSSTKVLFLYDGASDYVEAINNSVYINNTITEGCAGSGEQYLYLFSTSNMMTSRSITVKLIRNNDPNDACKLIGFTNINTHTKTSVGLEENKTVIRTFVTSYIQTLPINLCKITFEYAKLKFRVFIAKGTGN